ncbi:uncharacterized protein LOC126748574 [Anthonomus grandis grandis]|uniref:uncharacterized protein LOC126748574 n=1 Tax=Anthonomus grandis grandis TaxID=2921223 RepID=UPI0021663184|nr:uncharacterized protein LOC126748574 [Anthonomus grandis grandis]
MGEPPKKDYPPGWNDPPMLNYSPSNPPPKSRIGSKRVAFPLGSANSSPQPVPSGESPKMPPLPSTDGSPCNEELYLRGSKNFNACLENLDEDSKEQVWMMLSAWQGGTFSDNVQEFLADLSEPLSLKTFSSVNPLNMRFTILAKDPGLQKYLPILKHLMSKCSAPV